MCSITLLMFNSLSRYLENDQPRWTTSEQQSDWIKDKHTNIYKRFTENITEGHFVIITTVTIQALSVNKGTSQIFDVYII